MQNFVGKLFMQISILLLQNLDFVLDVNSGISSGAMIVKLEDIGLQVRFEFCFEHLFA